MQENQLPTSFERKRAVVIAVLFLALGWILAKNNIKPEVVTRTEIKEQVRVQTNVRWRTLETKKPDGTVVTETVADSDTHSDTQIDTKMETKTTNLSRYRLGLRYRTEKAIVPVGPELDAGVRLGNLPVFLNGSINQQLGVTLGISIDF
jgi:hypothetical protein